MTKRNVYINVLTVLFAFITVSVNCFANVALPAVFSDHMVLQQKSTAQFWGWADPGETVSISVDWSAKSNAVTTNDSGKWMLTLQTPAAGGPYTIRINGKNKLEIKDVLIGEVWVCSGQSNMVFSLKSSYEAGAEIEKANYPSIRYFSVERQYGPHPFEDAPGSVWKKTTSQTAPSFSAVAYFFAKKIHETLHVPVGIIYAAWGGTPAEAWTPSTVIKNDDSLSLYIDRWKYIQENVGKDSAEYHIKLKQWEQNNNSSVKKPGEPQTFYYYKRPWREPGVLFNGMISPVIPYAIKGVLWYQGESNVGYADEYEYLFTKMIESWRKQWHKNLPFYFVQLAAYGYDRMDAAARVRQAQYNVAKKLANTGMAVTVDVGNMNDIHYTHKKEVGGRLAFIALAKNYGYKNIIYQGPECTSVIKKGKKLELTFDQSLFTDDKKKVAGFEIGYYQNDSLIFLKATSSIYDNKIYVWNENIKDPIVIRYAWLDIGEANIVNKEGLPAPPFQKKL